MHIILLKKKTNFLLNSELKKKKKNERKISASKIYWEENVLQRQKQSEGKCPKGNCPPFMQEWLELKYILNHLLNI